MQVKKMSTSPKGLNSCFAINKHYIMTSLSEAFCSFSLSVKNDVKPPPPTLCPLPSALCPATKKNAAKCHFAKTLFTHNDHSTV